MNTLRPKRETLNIQGEISYSEGRRAWNVLRFKQDLLKEFPQLKERREKFGYILTMHRSVEDLKKAILKLNKNDAIPILMHLCRK
jgi:hypothetical protein